MFATADLDVCRTPIACVCRDTHQSDSMEMQKMRMAKFEWSFGLQKVLDHLDDSLKLL